MKKIAKGHYQLEDLTIKFSKRMDMGLWFVYNAKDLTKSLWCDSTVKTFVSFKEAKNYALGTI
jgi:hypothetical protein